MKLIRVKPSQVKVPEIRVRARFDAEIWAQFQNSIKEAGIISPVIVCQIKEDLVLVDGAHRLEEAIAQGLPTVDAVVFEGDMVDVLTKNLFLDHTRGKTPVSEMIKVIGALATEYNLDSDQIREKTGLTRDYIEKLIKISLASPSVQQALDEGIIGVGIAFELCRLPYAIQQDEVIAKQQVFRFPVKDVKELVDNTLAAMQELAETPPATPETEPRPTPVYHCEGCKDPVEPKYLRPVMLCPNCFGEVWRLAKLHQPAQEKVEEETHTP